MTRSQHIVQRTGAMLVRRRPGRRSFLQRSALVATALAVNPWEFLLRPTSAYASVCGPGASCDSGWTAFCCTVNAGANTCPDGSFAAGWWKVSSSAFCGGSDRYVVDCNRLPGATCGCHCADGPCDQRKTCCNAFRYGQCNQQVPGITEVVCRIVICTPPWEWDASCTATDRTDERTREHSASCLNPPNPTEIAIAYQDAGLVGSALGATMGAELQTSGGGAWQAYEHGVISLSSYGLITAVGPDAEVYRDAGGATGPLGPLLAPSQPIDGGSVLHAEHGAVYSPSDGPAVALHGQLDAGYLQHGGPTGWLGFPATGVLDAPGGRHRVDFQAGWSLVWAPESGVVRLLPEDVEVPEDPAAWPATATVRRWAGPGRIETAATVALQATAHRPDAVVLASGADFADSLAGGVLAALRGGPVLLTWPDRLPAATADVLIELAPREVLVIGGEQAIGGQVLDEVATAVPEARITRIAGPDRFATAGRVADAAVPAAADPDGPGVGTVVLASGRGFTDALVATPGAARHGAPILLTEPDGLPAHSAEALDLLRPETVIVIGGADAVGREVEEAVQRQTDAAVIRVSGTGAPETAVAAGRHFGPQTARTAVVASADSFADALSAGAAAAAVGGPLLLATAQTLPLATREALATLGPREIIIVGGEVALLPQVMAMLQATPVEPYQPRRRPDTPPEIPQPPRPEPTPEPSASGS